jgi:dephospho-CoA kinase
MILVGLTGGIGSGKTTIAKMFNALGIPIYIADDEAKKLMRNSKVIKKKLVALFGDDAYVGDELNKSFIANIIFENKEYLQKMNAIVHPKVGQHFKKWALKQDSKYIIKEAAILFENGSYKDYDYIITVTAPTDLKIERLLNREQTTKNKITSIMNNQWSDQEKIKRSHYVIENINLEDSRAQVQKIHNKILKLCEKP